MDGLILMGISVIGALLILIVLYLMDIVEILKKDNSKEEDKK